MKPNLLLLVFSLFAYSCWGDSYEDDNNNCHYCYFVQHLLIISYMMDSLRIDRSEELISFLIPLSVWPKSVNTHFIDCLKLLDPLWVYRLPLNRSCIVGNHACDSADSEQRAPLYPQPSRENRGIRPLLKTAPDLSILRPNVSTINISLESPV